MGQGMIHKLIGVLMNVAREMGARCDCADMERTAVIVHRIMSYQSRQFHTLEHVFGFLEGADAYTALAAVFHDLVYFQVDDGLPPEIEALVGDSIERQGANLRIIAAVPEGDRSLRACMTLFGFEHGAILSPYGGLNEFLSALAMMRILEGHLDFAQLISVAACIEASIPFRVAGGGASPGIALESRLRALSAAGIAELDEPLVVGIVNRATAFGNADVKDFSLGDPGRFLSNTWKLLPESNAPLRRKGVFSVKEYRVALEKMLAFFRSLDPDSIYHEFRGLPAPAEMERLGKAARRNLVYAQTYMKAKLLAVGLLEAVAEVSGGDAPMALFMGDVPADGEEQESILSFLPVAPVPGWLDTRNPVYKLLKDGRLDGSSFDLKNSPLALHLYHRLKPGTWSALGLAAEELFAGRMDADAFLAGFGREFLADFIPACTRIAPTRKTALEDWAAKRFAES